MKIEQRQNGRGGLYLVVIAGVALWFISRGEKGKEPGTVVGEAQVSASLGSVSVRAMMGSHLLTKVAGDKATVAVAVNGQTRDADGALVNWPMELILRLGHSTLFGWKMPQELNSSWPFGHAVNPLSHIGDRTISRTFTVPPDNDQAWDIKAWLYALPSDAQGLPVGNPSDFILASNGLEEGLDPGSIPSDETVGSTRWKGLAYAEHKGAIRSVDGSALVSASLGIVTVSQRHRGGPLRRRIAA